MVPPQGLRGPTPDIETDLFNRDKTPEDDFSIIRNGMLRDPDIPWEVKGIVGNLLSHAPGFKITLDVLLKQTSSGKDATKRALELSRKAGYVLRGERLRYPEGAKNAKGKDISGALGPYQWWFTTDPVKVAELRAKYEQENPDADNSGKPAQVLTRDDSGKFAPQQSTRAGNPQQSTEDVSAGQVGTGGVSAGHHKRGKTSASDPADKRRLSKKTNNQKTNSPYPPEGPSGDDTSRQANEGGGGALFGMDEVLPEPPVGMGGQPEPVAEVATRRGGAVSLREYDAPRVVDRWAATLRGSSAIEGSLKKELIKRVRGIIADNPTCDEVTLIAALNEYMINGEHPGYLPYAFRKVQQQRVKAANPQFQETPRQQMERGFYEQQLAQQGEGIPGRTSLEEVSEAYWDSLLSGVAPSSTLSNTLWCDKCDPDNPGWLPRDVDERGREHGPVRKCECRKQRETSRQKVRNAADQYFEDQFAAFADSGSEGAVLDAELVDEQPPTTNMYGVRS